MSADHQKRPKRVRAVERIEDWADARYSHVPPRAAIDARLTLAHFRVLVLIGKVNTQHGWCQLSQSATADLFGMHRKTVNAAVTDLVAWGYVEKQTQARTKTSFCHYRVLIDAPETDDDDADTSPQGVPSTSYTPQEGGVPPTDGTGVTSGSYTGAVPQVTPPYISLDHRSEITPPTPQGAGGEGHSRDRSNGAGGKPLGQGLVAGGRRAERVSPATSETGWARKWDEAAREAVAHVRAGVKTAHVAGAFLDHVRGLLNPPADVDGASYVRQLAAKLRDHASADLVRAAAILTGLVPPIAGHDDVARKRDLPNAVDVGRLAEAVKAERLRGEAAATPGAPAAVAGADPQIVARTGEVITRLKAMIGAPAFDAWLKGCQLVRVEDGGRLIVAAPTAFFAARINGSWRDQLVSAACAVLPGVRLADAIDAAKLGRAA